jgi:putative sugar O-methyltransferase
MAGVARQLLWTSPSTDDRLQRHFFNADHKADTTNGARILIAGPTDSLTEMLECLRGGDPIYHPSRFWESFNERNNRELTEQGFDNMKRTLATNYFTWILDWKHEQFQGLVRATHLRDWPSILLELPLIDPGFAIPRRLQVQMTVFTRMLWKFVLRRDPENLLGRLAEPTLGNPFPIRLGGKLISQDLANSVLEYNSIREHFRPASTERPTICELGAGYGRNAYVFLSALKQTKYIIVDIPPALYVSQRYLSKLFPERRIFQFRRFDAFSEIADEFRAADIVFVLPHQAELLPPKSVDLFLNISSLQEMTIAQIGAYYRLIDRLTRGSFYSKQWYVHQNTFDKVRVSIEDYPTPDHWRQLFVRPAPIQPSFFEAMYAL